PLDPVLLKAVAKSPAERFASAGEFALALSQVRFDSARPPVRGRSGRLARSIAIFSLLALAACLLWGTWIMPPKPDRNSPDDVSLADRTSAHLSLVLSSAEGNGTELRYAREPAVVKPQTNPELGPPAEVASPPLGNSAGDGG